MQIQQVYITADGTTFSTRSDAEQYERELPARLRMKDYSPAELVERELHNRIQELVTTISNHANTITTACNPDEDWPLDGEYVNSEEIARLAHLLENLAQQLSTLQEHYELVTDAELECEQDSKVCQFDWCEREPVNQYGWCEVHMDPKYWCHQCWQRHAVTGTGAQALCTPCKTGSKQENTLAARFA